MKPRSLDNLLDAYCEIWSNGRIPYKGHNPHYEKQTADRMKEFFKTQDCFDRHNMSGHFTGSALVVTPDLQNVLLTLHAKMKRWLQLGGHADNDPEIDRVAMREAEEESGLDHLEFIPWESIVLQHDNAKKTSSLCPIPFDIDIHLIPASKKTPEHFHFDMRFLIQTPQPEEISITEESLDLRWFSVREAFNVTQEVSMHRQFAKLEAIRDLIPNPVGLTLPPHAPLLRM